MSSPSARPTDAGAGKVGVNVQTASILADTDRGLSAREGFVCTDWMETCRVTKVADGSLLRTYAEHTSAAEGGTGERLVAERLTEQVRVVASATNRVEGPGNHWDITRPKAVLSVDQLATVVSQPWWGFGLPAEYAVSATCRPTRTSRMHHRRVGHRRLTTDEPPGCPRASRRRVPAQAC